jgi:hypothetical protein
VPYRRERKTSQGRSENSCSVKKAEWINRLWTDDFIEDQTEDVRTRNGG